VIDAAREVGEGGGLLVCGRERGKKRGARDAAAPILKGPTVGEGRGGGQHGGGAARCARSERGASG
jgi:hypothetical protein